MTRHPPKPPPSPPPPPSQSPKKPPKSRFLKEKKMKKPHPAIRVVGAVTKAVDAQRARILTGRHTHPCRHGDGRDNAFQAAINTRGHQAANVLQDRKSTRLNSSH